MIKVADVLKVKGIRGTTLYFEVNKIYPRGIMGDDPSYTVIEATRISKKLRHSGYPNEWISFGRRTYISVNNTTGKALAYHIIENLGKVR